MAAALQGGARGNNLLPRIIEDPLVIPNTTTTNLSIEQSKILIADVDAVVIATDQFMTVDRQSSRRHNTEFLSISAGSAGGNPLRTFVDATYPLGLNALGRARTAPTTGQMALHSQRIILVRLNDSVARAPTLLELANLRACYTNALQQAFAPSIPGPPIRSIVFQLMGVLPLRYPPIAAANAALQAITGWFAPGNAPTPAITAARRAQFQNIFIILPWTKALQPERGEAGLRDLWDYWMGLPAAPPPPPMRVSVRRLTREANAWHQIGGRGRAPAIPIPGVAIANARRTHRSGILT